MVTLDLVTSGLLRLVVKRLPLELGGLRRLILDLIVKARVPQSNSVRANFIYSVRHQVTTTFCGICFHIIAI